MLLDSLVSALTVMPSMPSGRLLVGSQNIWTFNHFLVLCEKIIHCIYILSVPVCLYLFIDANLLSV